MRVVICFAKHEELKESPLSQKGHWKPEKYHVKKRYTYSFIFRDVIDGPVS